MEPIIIFCICFVGIIVAFIMIDVVKCIKKKYCKKPSIPVESKEAV